MNRNKLTKVFSTTLSIALVATSAPMPIGAVGPEISAPAFVGQLTPPERFGYVASSFAPNGETHPRMVLIADLHAHIEVQHNIKGILQHVIGQLRAAGSSMAGKTVPVFVEGGWDKGLEEPLKTVQNSSVRSFLAEYLLSKAEINAAQSYSENNAGANQVSLIGVESKAEYLFNRAQFLKTYPSRKALLEAIQNEEVTIREVTRYLTNGTFAHLQDMRDGYNAGRVRPEAFARALGQLARRNGINNGHVRLLQDISNASQADVDVALSEVYGSVLKAVSAKRPLSAFLRQSIDNETAIRENLARIDASLDLLKRLVSDQLTPSEVPLALAKMPVLIQTAQLLLDKSSLKNTAADVIRDSFNFYPYAKLRDVTLSDNSVKALNSFGPDATGILVTGGFHTEAIAERLRQQQISYIVINPSITRDLSSEEQMNYMRRMGDEHVTTGEIERDVESLRRKQPVRAQAASGVMSDIDAAKKPGSEQYLGGVDLVAINRVLAADANALAKELTAKQSAFQLSQPAARDVEALSAAQNQVLKIAKEADNVPAAKVKALADALASPDNMFITLSNINGKLETVAGLQGEDAAALADDLNGVAAIAEGGQQKAASVDQFNIIGIDNATERIGSTARVYIDENTGIRTLVMDKARLKNYIAGRNATTAEGKAAYDRAKQNVIHDVTHVYDVQGRNETATQLKGVANHILLNAMRVGLNNEAAIRAEVERIVASLLVDAKTAKGNQLLAKILSSEGLAEAITDAINPEALSSVNAQAIFDALRNAEPAATDLQLKQAIGDTKGSFWSRSAFDITGDHKATALEIIKSLGLDAKNLTKEDIARVVAELAKQLSVDVAQAEAILNAA